MFFDEDEEWELGPAHHASWFGHAEMIADKASSPGTAGGVPAQRDLFGSEPAEP